MAGAGVLEVSDATFEQEVLKSEQPVLVDFWAVWCGPCRAIAPIVDGVAQTYAGKLKVAKVDVDHNAATPSRYGIRGIPALLFFKGQIGAHGCNVIDISDGGAKLRTHNLSVLPNTFELTFDNFLTIRQCRLIWRDSDFLGVAFEN